MLIIAVLPLVFYGIITDKRIIAGQIEDNGLYLVKNLARNSETGVFSENTHFLQTPLEAIMEQKEVVWASVYNRDGDPIWSSAKSGLHLPPIPDEIKSAAETETIKESYRKSRKTGSMRVLDYFAPIYLRKDAIGIGDLERFDFADIEDELIGLARVGVSLESVDKRINQILGTAGILTAIYCVLSILAIKYIAGTITRPVRILSAGAQEIGRGNLQTRIQVTPGDEIGDLTESFNHMADQLSIEMEQRKATEMEREQLLKDLATKNRELESIVYVASHDLRSPLVNIQGFSRELEQSCSTIHSAINASQLDDPEKLQLIRKVEQDIPEAISYITSSANRMDILLKGLLRLSRLGTAALTVEKLEMNDIVKRVLDSMSYQIQKAGARVQTDELPPSYGDAMQIMQVFSNLIDNALKYLDSDRKGHIVISGSRDAARTIYSVKDNGIGIKDNHKDKVFELFHRLDPSGPVPGEGLGLTIIQRIISRHNGSVWLESEPGADSTFYISLPAEPF